MIMYKPTGTLVRSVISIAVGAMLIKWADKVTDTLVVILGIMLIVPLLAALVSLAFQRSKGKDISLFPVIGGIGSAVLGTVMVVMPEVFTTFLALFIGIIMVTAGIRQIVAVYPFVRSGSNYIYYITPALLVIVGILTIVKFKSVASTLWIIVGIIMQIYGISEIFNLIIFRNKTGNDSNIEDAEIIE